MSEFNNDFVEAAIEEIEEPTPAVEEVVEAPAVEEEIAEVPTEEPVVKEKPKAKKAEKAKPVADGGLVALFSERNVNWDGVGRLKLGYNIVSQEVADKWLASGSKRVRLVNPEEIATKVAK